MTELESAPLGQPVELTKIGRELKKLWESTGGTNIRASLVNFAVVCKGPEALVENTRVITDFTRDHACRAILIAREEAAGEPSVQAWVNAVCHLPRAGAKHVCCEQISLLVSGGTQQTLLNALFANLDSDLPLYLWWQCDLPSSSELWTWVDRLIFDSRDWKEPGRQFRQLQESLRTAGARLVLCDLNWTRTLHFRQALAQTFDHPDHLRELPRLRRVCIAHAPGYESTALLFLAWIAGQLGWTTGMHAQGKVSFHDRSENAIECTLEKAEGSPVSKCLVASDDASFAITREPRAPFIRAETRLPGRPAVQHLFPAGADELAPLLGEEVSLGGQHRVYLKAIAAAESIL